MVSLDQAAEVSEPLMTKMMLDPFRLRHTQLMLPPDRAGDRVI
jgi:hypothetical protein